jgi:hypothetical protein
MKKDDSSNRNMRSNEDLNREVGFSNKAGFEIGVS